ncbi:hypothetical protein C7999DRAFT_13850 [Corynascus novoguineensis]|uniref:BTB domain-containing protein n=1 Tax=Corynascus novoguineensis TaxID=1126955 RepID=A0AAN7CUA4_9PEZI|nr:hypothetical protein C7999DRAFT_13850 [Corynascus novoguineensis]
MKSSNPLPNQSATSYADVLRGNKVFAPRSRPAADTEAEKVPISKVVAAPKTAQKTVQEKVQKKKGVKSAQKGSKSGSKRSREGASQAMQQANSSRIKLPQAGNCSATERLTNSHFSYAEAVKGEKSAMALQFRDGEVANKTVIVQFTLSYLSAVESPPNMPLYFEFEPPEDSISSYKKRTDGVATCQNNSKSLKDRADEPALRFAGHITTNQPRQPSYRTPPAPFPATTFRNLPNDPLVETTMQYATMNEYGRRSFAGERDVRQARLIHCHALRLIDLWECQYEWDVLVTCDKHSWRVHHDILCHESEWFKDRLPPKDPNGGYIRFNCNGHDPKQLANVLRWMYLHTDEYKSDLELRSAFDGRPILRAVFTYIASASVSHSRARDAAVAAIADATWRLRLFFAEQTPRQIARLLDLSQLHLPLAAALRMAFEQDGLRLPRVPASTAAATANGFLGREHILNDSDDRNSNEDKEGEDYESGYDYDGFEEDDDDDGDVNEDEADEGKSDNDDNGDRVGSVDDKADMMTLRGMLAHLCHEILPFLAHNEGFVEAFKAHWVPELWRSVISDGIYFDEQGVLAQYGEMMKGAINDSKRAAAAGAGFVSVYYGGNNYPASGSKKRKRRANQEPQEEKFEIWRDAQPGEFATSPCWTRPERSYEADDHMINGEQLAPEQQREVVKENSLTPRERGRGAQARGGVGRGMLQHRHNFTNSEFPADDDSSNNHAAQRRRGNNWVAPDMHGDTTVHNGAGRARPNMTSLR